MEPRRGDAARDREAAQAGGDGEAGAASVGAAQHGLAWPEFDRLLRGMNETNAEMRRMVEQAERQFFATEPPAADEARRRQRTESPIHSEWEMFTLDEMGAVGEEEALATSPQERRQGAAELGGRSGEERDGLEARPERGLERERDVSPRESERGGGVPLEEGPRSPPDFLRPLDTYSELRRAERENGGAAAVAAMGGGGLEMGLGAAHGRGALRGDGRAAADIRALSERMRFSPDELDEDEFVDMGLEEEPEPARGGPGSGAHGRAAIRSSMPLARPPRAADAHVPVSTSMDGEAMAALERAGGVAATAAEAADQERARRLVSPMLTKVRRPLFLDDPKLAGGAAPHALPIAGAAPPSLPAPSAAQPKPRAASSTSSSLSPPAPGASPYRLSPERPSIPRANPFTCQPCKDPGFRSPPPKQPRNIANFHPQTNFLSLSPSTSPAPRSPLRSSTSPPL